MYRRPHHSSLRFIAKLPLVCNLRFRRLVICTTHDYVCEGEDVLAHFNSHKDHKDWWRPYMAGARQGLVRDTVQGLIDLAFEEQTTDVPTLADHLLNDAGEEPIEGLGIYQGYMCRGCGGNPVSYAARAAALRSDCTCSKEPIYFQQASRNPSSGILHKPRKVCLPL